MHLTLLKPDGSGKIERTREQPDKIIIGSPHQLADPWTPNDLLAGMAVTEGSPIGYRAVSTSGTGLALAAGAAGFVPNLASAIPVEHQAVTICDADRACCWCDDRAQRSSAVAAVLEFGMDSSSSTGGQLLRDQGDEGVRARHDRAEHFKGNTGQPLKGMIERAWPKRRSR